MLEHGQFKKEPFSFPSINRNVFSPGQPAPGGTEFKPQNEQTQLRIPVLAAPTLSPTSNQTGNESAGSFSSAQGVPAPPGFGPYAPSSFSHVEEHNNPRKPRRRRISVPLLGSILIVVVVVGYIFWNLIMVTVPAVTLYQVSQQNVSQDVGGGGIIYPRQELDISYPVAERILGVMVIPGDRVTPNQPLIQLDPSLLNSQVQQAANDMAAAQAYLEAVSISWSGACLQKRGRGSQLGEQH